MALPELVKDIEARVKKPGDTMTGNLTLDSENHIKIKTYRKTPSGGGWAFNLVEAIEEDSAIFFNFGLHGTNEDYSYTYIGNYDYSSNYNLKIHKNGTVQAYLFSGNFSGNLSGTWENKPLSSFYCDRGPLLQNNNYDANKLLPGFYLVRGSSYGVGTGEAHKNFVGENTNLANLIGIQFSTPAWGGSLSYRHNWGNETANGNEGWSNWLTLLDSSNYLTWVPDKNNLINMLGDVNSSANLGRRSSIFRTTSTTCDGVAPSAYSVVARLRSGYNGSYDLWISSDVNNKFYMAKTADSSLVSASSWKEILTYKHSYRQSHRDFTQGTLVETDINFSVVTGDAWLLEIKGNSYFSLYPYCSTFQGYIYNNTTISQGGIHYGLPLNGIVLFCYNNHLCFWWPRQVYWQGFDIFCSSVSNASNLKENRVISITDSAKPTNITKEMALNSYFKRSWLEGDAVTGAVWNDYAECREADTIEPGYVLVETGDDSLTKSTERLSPFAGVSSDTWGFSQGETDKAKTPIAVAGRVLVYPWQDRNNYKPGDCVCAAPEGKVDIMTREEIIQYPDRIVGTVSSVPTYDKWGGGKKADREPVDVNGRIWIKVR